MNDDELDERLREAARGVQRAAGDAARGDVGEDRGRAAAGDQPAPVEAAKPADALVLRPRAAPRPGRRPRRRSWWSESASAGSRSGPAGDRGLGRPLRQRAPTYRLAAQEHLGQSEAFLTLFRTSVQERTDHRLASASARQLLATNRLLLDSPAAIDPKTRLLLEDLELVLAEIAQLSPQSRAEDLQLIREGIERGNVMPRLRTAVPAGAAPTQGVLVMYRMQLGLAVAAAIGAGGWWTPSRDVAVDIQAVQGTAAEPAASPPAPWLQGDPADSLYRAAREALNQREYRTAADLFAQIPARFPKSGYAPDALYWQAFALYRVGREPRAARGARRAAAPARALPRRGHQGRRRRARAADPGRAGAAGRRGRRAAVRSGQREQAAEPPSRPKPPEPPEAPEPPEPPDHRGHMSRHDKDDRCDDDGDDMKIAAINALIHMDSEQGAADPHEGARAARCGVGLPPAQGGVPHLPGRRRRRGGDPARRRPATIRIPRCGSRRSSGSRRWARSARSARSTRSSAPRPTGSSRTRRSSRSRSRTVPEARQSLRTYAERADAPESLREQAIFWIGQSGGKESTAYLRELFGRIKGEELRKKILFSVSQMGGAENGKWLVGVARDRTQPIEIRKQALFWAGQGGASMADLASLYSAFDDREMKDQLIFVYSQRDEPAAVDKLLEIARARSRPRAAEEGALLAGAERRSPRREGAPGHHRAAVRRRRPCEPPGGSRRSRRCFRLRSRPSRWRSGCRQRRRRHGAAELRGAGGVCSRGPGSITIIDDEDDDRSGRTTASGARCGSRSASGAAG